jgi:hypothetical protein
MRPVNVAASCAEDDRPNDLDELSPQIPAEHRLPLQPLGIPLLVGLRLRERAAARV